MAERNASQLKVKAQALLFLPWVLNICIYYISTSLYLCMCVYRYMDMDIEDKDMQRHIDMGRDMGILCPYLGFSGGG